jgi:hypothetical protein
MFSDLSLDLKRYICLFLKHKDIKKLDLKFYEDEYDVFWKEKMTNLTDEKVSNGTSYRDFYEYLVYKKPIQEGTWNNKTLEKYIDDELFLEKFVNIKDSLGRTALSMATAQPKEKLLKLLSYGADVNSQSNKGSTALMFCVRDIPLFHECEENVKILLEAGTNVNLQDRFGYTVLMDATLNNSVKIIRLLLEHGADASLMDDRGYNSLNLATDEIRSLIAEFGK